MQLFDYYILVCEYFECRGKHNTESNSVRGTYFLLRDPFLSFLQLHVVYARLEGEVNSGGYTGTWSIKLFYELFYLALRTEPFSIYQIIWMKKKTLFL